LGAWFAVTLYISVMLYSYRDVESVLFGYRGFLYNPPPFEYTLFSYVLAWIALIIVPKSLSQPSDIAAIILYVVVFIPSLFMPYHVTGNSPDRVLSLVLSFWAAFMVFLAVLRLQVKPLKFVNVDRESLIKVLSILTVLLSFAILALNGFQFNLDFSDVYDRRLAARETIAGGSAAGFAIAFLNTVFAPLCVLYGITQRRWILLGIGCLGLITIFSLSGTKSTILTPIFMLGVYWLMAKSPQRILRNTAITCTVGIVLGAAQYLYFSQPYISAFFTNRLVVTRGVGLAHYWMRFEEDPVNMGDSSIAAAFGVRPRPSKAFEVGTLYGFGPQDNYIAGMWPSMYANFGVLGFFVASLVAAAILKLFDAMSNKRSLIFLSSITALIGLTWCDAALETSILTNGIALLLVFAYFLRQPDEVVA